MGIPNRCTNSGGEIFSTHTLPVSAKYCAFAAVSVSPSKYGLRNTVTTVVLKAEFAQSYIAQPKISFLSLIGTVAVDILSSGKVSTILSVKTLIVLVWLRKYKNMIKSWRVREGKKFENWLKNPLHICNPSYIIIICYPTPHVGCIRVYTDIQQDPGI